ncbi:sensor domain-containing diguanylate cyclase [Candidatus Blastococcus massiliensis]|uniref:sensor domain-containing diguanylate cyclase n=1 Tax=Candidatus Blastococcus massiliensis TaxID=1470358 RepID=UPI0012DCD617|nr:sensor domain-containing diguanylate cyclase [Candidatus Blastococcus massiliensis]
MLGLRKPRLGVPWAIVVLTACVVAIAAALFVVGVRPLSGAPTALTLPWVFWVATFLVAETLVVNVQWQREAHMFSMGDLVLAGGLLLATPRDLVVAQVVACAVLLVVQRRQRGVKLVFNLAVCALNASLATTVFAALAGTTGTWDWLAALLAVPLSTAVGDLFIVAAIAISEGRAELAPFVEMFTLSVPFSLGSAALGVVMARSAVSDPASLALLTVPTLLIVASYRAYTGAREQRENLRVLHEVTSLLHTSGDSEEALGHFLDSVRSAFRAEMAELVLLGPADREGATVSRSREGAEAVVMAPLDDHEGHRRLVHLATASGALTSRTGTGPVQHLARYISGRGMKDAMVAALRTEDRVHGLLLVGGRFGDSTTFSSSDLALLDTFARHVATTLERGRLEENLRQVTDLKEQLRHQALHDPLTGLPNRTLILDRVRQAVDSARRTAIWPAVLYLDLDGFKQVNDTFGHEAGDVLLRTVADRLRSCLRPGDTAARMGGDEFVVLLDGPIDRVDVVGVVDRIRAQLDLPVVLAGDVVTTVGASIGVALGGETVADADALVRQADSAMYTAKRAPDVRFLVHEPAQDVQVARTGPAAAN